MKHLKTYKIFESFDSLPEIDQNIKDMLLELEDIGFICKMVTNNSRILISIGNGSTTGFYTFLFKRIQEVCLRIIRYMIENGNWQVKIARVIDHGTRIEIVEKLSFDMILSKLDSDEEDISGGIHSNEFRLFFTKL